MNHRLDRTPRGGRPKLKWLVSLPAFALACVVAAPEAIAQVEVSVSADDADASESPPDNGQFVVRRAGGSHLTPVTVSYDVSGSASSGADFAPLGGSVRLGVLQAEAPIDVVVSGDDELFEGDETVTVTLREDPSITIVQGRATVTIADSPHSVSVADSSDATEGPVNAGTVLVSLGAQNESGSDLTVEYSVAGSASPGTDYETLSGDVLIPVGSSTATIEVTPIPDDELEPDESIEITLTATSNPEAPVGEPASGALVIEDDEARGDDDEDGIPNTDECPDFSPCPDTDDDGSPDYQDPDDDGDGIPTGFENPPDQDTDDDGNPDFLDDDDDGDGRLTRDEDTDEDGDGNPATNPTDLDDDGIPDYLDAEDQGGPTGDLDGDGLSNEREDELGTDPQNPDTDSDGVGDGDEDAAGTDPLDHTSFEDADGDTVPDAIETADGTDPNDPDSFTDSDGGGTADHMETTTYASHGLPPGDAQDPLDDWRDSDGDGIPDRLEIVTGSDPDATDSPTADGAGDDDEDGIANAVEAYLEAMGVVAVDETSDFDRDGYPDAAEVALGLNPLRAAGKDSDSDGVADVIELIAGVDIDATTDSDGDGVPDAREIALDADSLDANSPVANGNLDDDDDGVSNAVEHVLQQLEGAGEAADDSDGDGLSDAEEIGFGTDPTRDEQPAPWIELAQADIGPVAALTTAGGVAMATAAVGGHQTGTLTYDWSASDNAVLAVASSGQSSKTLTFSPATLPPGPYNLVLRVERSLGDFSSEASELVYTINVLADAEADEIADADNDGIPDSADDIDARLGFANEVEAHDGVQMQAEPGLRLQLGTTARTRRSTSARVTQEDIASAGDGNGGNVGNSEDSFDYVGGIYDFEVTNLPEPGSTARIVIPQAMPVAEFPEYRKFQPGSGWVEFEEDASNSIESAAGSSAGCPAPGDSSYQPGIAPGHFCIQLTIEDGGPNDGDAELGPNGVIRDPGGVATPKGEVAVGQGGGGTGPAFFVLLGTLVWLASIRRNRRAMPLASRTLLAQCFCSLYMHSATSHADAFVGGGAGLSALDPETAGTPFSTADDQDIGYKFFAGFDLTPVSRSLSVEAFWADLGQATLNNGATIDYSLYGAGLMYGIGSVKYPRVSGFLETGVARLDASANIPFHQENETSVFFGISGAFAIRRHWFLQLEYEYFTEDAQFLSLSLVKRFRLNNAERPQTYPLPPD